MRWKNREESRSRCMTGGKALFGGAGGSSFHEEGLDWLFLGSTVCPGLRDPLKSGGLVN